MPTVFFQEITGTAEPPIVQSSTTAEPPLFKYQLQLPSPAVILDMVIRGTKMISKTCYKKTNYSNVKGKKVLW